MPAKSAIDNQNPAVSARPARNGLMPPSARSKTPFSRKILSQIHFPAQEKKQYLSKRTQSQTGQFSIFVPSLASKVARPKPLGKWYEGTMARR